MDCLLILLLKTCILERRITGRTEQAGDFESSSGPGWQMIVPGDEAEMKMKYPGSWVNRQIAVY